MGRSGSDNNGFAFMLFYRLLCRVQFFGVEIVVDGEVAYVAEQYIVGHKPVGQRFNLFFVFKKVSC